MTRTHTLALVTTLALSGCCSFAPCHPGTYIAGVVTDARTGAPVQGASVRLYHYEAAAKVNGCFALGGPDALPFEFAVSAPGYDPVAVKAVPGSFQADVRLAPSGSGSTTPRLDKITRERYAELRKSCP